MTRSRLIRGRTVRRLTTASAAVLLIVVGAVAFRELSAGSDIPENPAGRIVGEPVSVPYDPDHLAAGGGRVWALASNGNRLVRLDTDSASIDTFSAGVDLGGGDFSDVAVGPNSVWTAHSVPVVGGIDRIDPVTGEAVQHIALPRAVAVDADEEAVWAVASGANEAAGKLVRIDPSHNRISGRATTVGPDPADVVVDDGAVWVANRAADAVWRIDPQTRAVIAKIPVGDEPDALAVTPGSVWVVNVGDRTLMRIDRSTNRVRGAPISLGKEIRDVVAADDALWVSAADGTVTRLDPDTGQQIGSPLAPASAPLALAADGSDVWVGSSFDQTLTRIEGGER